MATTPPILLACFPFSKRPSIFGMRPSGMLVTQNSPVPFLFNALQVALEEERSKETTTRRAKSDTQSYAIALYKALSPLSPGACRAPDASARRDCPPATALSAWRTARLSRVTGNMGHGVYCRSDDRTWRKLHGGRILPGMTVVRAQKVSRIGLCAICIASLECWLRVRFRRGSWTILSGPPETLCTVGRGTRKVCEPSFFS
ncbi:hypothetical protein BB8028_0001g17070 [Beauveria bassiana]|uniref:Uncharacterized protein n=1 Tax=Beauveria bassiana TaxID=176275 RepID=A0A2S7Y0J8_BEABA|nr:hypothetical protein BB8028_0001g17070 [Beauveria bassiana]